MGMRLLDDGEVHIWTARSNAPDISLTTLEKLLNDGEKARASRFIFERHRFAFTFAHGVLRQILSSYLDQAPERIRFDHNAFGKPFLAEPDAARGTQFNMSHSGDAVLVALTRGRHIGADIEQMRVMRDFALIAKSNFTPQECAMIHCHPSDLQPRAFFTCWTRKEAFIKAVGKGLSIPLNTFDSSIPAGQPGIRLITPNEAPDVESWWIADLKVPEDYAGAIAIEKGFDQLSYYTWSQSRRS
jgi:4'-phosphopantetheinyl transferase